MGTNSRLHSAKRAKNDEWYTRYSDIWEEISAYVHHNEDLFRGKIVLCPCDDPEWSNFKKYFELNFSRLGIRRLVCTSYAQGAENGQVSMFDTDEETHGKLYVKTAGREFNGHLKGDGDFRSEEVTRLRDEADIIITNPPFSLFRSFMKWVMAVDRQFIILGNMNAITYKEVFPYIKDNKVWLGYRKLNKEMFFNVPDEQKQWLLENKKEGSAYKIVDGVVMARGAFACWFTNIDHGKRHEELKLMTAEDNLKYNEKLKKKLEKDYGKLEYPHYDNYDAIEVPFVDAIPSDYVPCWFECPKREECEWAKAKGIDDEKTALCELNPDGKKKRHLEENAVELSEHQSHSSINTVRNSTESSESSTTETMAIGTCASVKSTEKRNISDSQYKKCSGVMGVPIFFLGNHNLAEFEIVGFRKGKDGKDLAYTREDKTIFPYFRILIRQL